MELIKVEIKKSLKSTYIWGISLSVIMLIYMAFYPSMSDAGFNELLDSKIRLLPEALLKSIGLSVLPNFSIFIEYYSYIFNFIVMGLVVYAMLLGTKSLAGEEGNKTIEFLYAKPITRNQILISKLVGSLILIFIVFLMLLITSIFGSIFWSNDNDIMNIIYLNILMLIPILVYFSIGYVISSYLKSDIKGISISLGIFFGSYIIGAISSIVSKLEFLKYLSPINYNQAQKITNYLQGNGDLNMLGIYLSIIIIICSIYIALIQYNKKDLII